MQAEQNSHLSQRSCCQPACFIPRWCQNASHECARYTSNSCTLGEGLLVSGLTAFARGNTCGMCYRVHAVLLLCAVASPVLLCAVDIPFLLSRECKLPCFFFSSCSCVRALSSFGLVSVVWMCAVFATELVSGNTSLPCFGRDSSSVNTMLPLFRHVVG